MRNVCELAVRDGRFKAAALVAVTGEIDLSSESWRTIIARGSYAQNLRYAVLLALLRLNFSTVATLIVAWSGSDGDEWRETEFGPVERLAASVLLGALFAKERPGPRFSAGVGRDFGSDCLRSNTAAVTGPMVSGSRVNTTLCAVSRSSSAWTSGTATEVSGMPGSARRRTAKPAGVLDQGLQPRLLPGGDGCGDRSPHPPVAGQAAARRPPTAVVSGHPGPVRKASWVSAWRRSTPSDPTTSSGEAGCAAVQRYCGVGPQHKDASESVRLTTDDQSLAGPTRMPQELPPDVSRGNVSIDDCTRATAQDCRCA